MADLELAYQQLVSLDDSDALLVLRGLEEKRRDREYAKYWSSDDDPNHQIFFDSIETDFAKFTKDIKTFCFLGGNRSSKTERGAFLAVAWLMGKEYFRYEPSWRFVKDLPIPEHGVNVWCVGLDFTVIRDVIWNEKLRRGHQHPGLLPATPNSFVLRVSDSEFSVSVDVNGRKSTLTCKSADSGREKFQSASVDLAWVDEEIEEEVFDEIFQRTLDCAGHIVVTLTPLNDVGSGVRSPWVFNLYQEFIKGKKDLCFISLNSLANPYIPIEEKERMKEKWAGHYEEGARLRGEFVRRSGLVFSQWDRTKHVLKNQFIPADWRRIVSIDPSGSGRTAACWLAVSPRNDVYLYRVYYETSQTISEHAKNIITRSNGEKIDQFYIDPYYGVSRNPETLKQAYQLYRDAGCPVRLAPRCQDYSLQVMQEYLSATLVPTSRHPKFYVVGDIPEWLNEIENYTWQFFTKGALKGLSSEKPAKKNDHLLDACRYALSTNPKGKSGSSSIGNYNPNASYT